MKIICKWIYMNKNRMISKTNHKVGEMNEKEVMDMIEKLLIQPETVRVIFEKED